MHKDDVLHLGNKLQSSTCSTDPKVLCSLCIIYIKSIGVVKSSLKIVFIINSVQFVENNKYIFDTSNSKRFGWHLDAVNIIGKHQQPEKILRASGADPD